MRLTESDASFLYVETASGPMHTAAMLVLEGELACESVVAQFKTRMHLIPRYRQKLAFVPFNLAHPKWVDDSAFAVENHVKPFHVTEGSTLEQAVDEILVLNGKLMDRSRPLWMTYVVSGVPGYTIVLSQVHHAMIDGVSGIELLSILMDFEPEPRPVPPPKVPWTPEPEPSALELVTEALRENAQKTAAEVRRSWPSDAKSRTLLAHGARAVSSFFTSPAVMAPWNAGFIGTGRRMRWTRHPFSEFREIRRAFGGTINDVVLAAISEGAARYLAQHDEDTDGRQLRIMCPVSVRTEDEKGALGNRVSGIFPLLPASPMPALERYHAVLAEMEGIKRDELAQALTLMTETTPSVPAMLMAPTLLVGTPFDPTVAAARFPLPVLPKIGSRPPLLGFNFTCTNVPGVQVPMYIAGHRMETMLGVLMLTGNLGYGVAVGSYNQEMIFAMIGETRLMPDLEVMAASVEAAFVELLAEARKVNGPPAAEPLKAGADRGRLPPADGADAAAKGAA
ncbi:MAG TPA: wax ester/triacylglycerol synthase family O-acyltransferase [Pseudomonadales bacterium]